MPSTQEKYNSTTPKKKKSTRKKVTSVNTTPRMTALTASGKETNRSERTGQMAGARQDALDKRVKKAGGAKKLVAAHKKTKSGLVKVGNVYTKKGSPRHKAYLKKKKR